VSKLNTLERMAKEATANPKIQNGTYYNVDRTQHDPVNDQDIFDALVAEERATWFSKGTEYVNGGDRLNNFNTVAKSQGITPLQVWAVYTTKHWLAIMEYCRTGHQGSEGIESRLMDLAVYAKLGRLLARQAQASAQPEPKQNPYCTEGLPRIAWQELQPGDCSTLVHGEYHTLAGQQDANWVRLACDSCKKFYDL
jgi:hypothetical protein